MITHFLPVLFFLFFFFCSFFVQKRTGTSLTCAPWGVGANQNSVAGLWKGANKRKVSVHHQIAISLSVRQGGAKFRRHFELYWWPLDRFSRDEAMRPSKLQRHRGTGLLTNILKHVWFFFLEFDFPDFVKRH